MMLRLGAPLHQRLFIRPRRHGKLSVGTSQRGVAHVGFEARDAFELGF